MNAAEIAAALVAKLDETARAEGRVVLASVAMETLSQEPVARIEASVQRKTRTLIFTAAEAFAAGGARVATASAIHRLMEQT
jgi:hypothetical protein